MIKIYQQIDWNNFHIGTNADLVPGAIDIEAPIYNSSTHKAKLVHNTWVIKPIIEWDLKDGQILIATQKEVKSIDEITLEETVSYEDDYSIQEIPKPSNYHSWINNQWIIDSIGLNLCKEEKLKYLADYRNNLLEVGVDFEGKTVKGREKDVIGILSVVIKLSAGLTSTWCYSSGEREDITTLDRAKVISSAINSLREGAYVKCSILEEQINNATTIEELDLIIWGD